MYQTKTDATDGTYLYSHPTKCRNIRSKRMNHHFMKEAFLEVSIFCLTMFLNVLIAKRNRNNNKTRIIN